LLWVECCRGDPISLLLVSWVTTLMSRVCKVLLKSSCRNLKVNPACLSTSAHASIEKCMCKSSSSKNQRAIYMFLNCIPCFKAVIRTCTQPRLFLSSRNMWPLPNITDYDSLSSHHYKLDKILSRLWKTTHWFTHLCYMVSRSGSKLIK
jgi:hypothetical protein